MGQLDQVSEAIGEIKGILQGVGVELKQIKEQVSNVRKKQDDMSLTGCALGATNSRRINAIEEHVKADTVSMRKLTGLVAIVSAVVAGIAEGLRRALG